MKDKITVLMDDGYMIINIDDFDYNIALNFCKYFYGSHAVNTNISNLNQEDYSFNILDLFFINEIIDNNEVVNYKIVQFLDEKHFEKLFDYWDTFPSTLIDPFSYKKIINLKQNYKQYINEAIIKDII